MSTSRHHMPWSLLPPLPLYGVGTRCVEALDHYVARQAYVCGARSPGVFFDPGTAYTPASTILGPGQVFVSRIRQLKCMTGIRNLHCGSLYNLGPLAEQNWHGAAVPGRRWCPLCFSSWDTNTSYELLAWYLPLVVRCPIHGCRLEDRCPHCGRTQIHGRPYGRRRRCVGCDKPLCNVPRWTPSSSYRTWAETEALTLIDFCADPAASRVPSSALNELLVAVRRCFELSIDVPESVKSAVSQFSADTAGIQRKMELLLNLCAIQSISMLDALLDPQASSSRPFPTIWSTYEPVDLCSQSTEMKLKILRSVLNRLQRRQRVFPLPSVYVVSDELSLPKFRVKDYRRQWVTDYNETRVRRTPLDSVQREIDSFYRAVLEYLKSSGVSPYDIQKSCLIVRSRLGAFNLKQPIKIKIAEACIFLRSELLEATAEARNAPCTF